MIHGVDTVRESLAEISTRLRDAVATEDYATAEKLLGKQRLLFEEYRTRTSPADPQFQRIAFETQSLLDWAVQMIRVQRASNSTQLQQAAGPREYPICVPVHRHTWKIEA